MFSRFSSFGRSNQHWAGRGGSARGHARPRRVHEKDGSLRPALAAGGREYRGGPGAASPSRLLAGDAVTCMPYVSENPLITEGKNLVVKNISRAIPGVALENRQLFFE